VAAHVTLAAADRARFRRLFTAALCNLQQLRIYWSPSENKLIARGLTAQKKHPIPADAQLVGEYTHPFNATDFLGDLEDVLTKIATQELARATGSGLAAA
jgi:hypothetical protein